MIRDIKVIFKFKFKFNVFLLDLLDLSWRVDIVHILSTAFC